MATEYGCNISNKFAFLDDDGSADTTELVARAAKAKKDAELAKKAAAAKAAAAPKPAPAAVNNNKENVGKPARGPRKDGERGPRTDRADRGPRPERQNNGERPPRRPRQEVQFDEEGKPIRRGPRRDNDKNRGPRRNDRISGSEKTGVRSVAKKDGHGKGNWGDNNDELVGETEQLITENKENDTENPEKAEGAVDEQPEEEKEPPKLTLSEWKAKQSLEKQTFKTRAANEGADQKNLSKFVALKKEDADEEEEEVEVEVPKTKRQQAQAVVDVRINFANPNRSERPERSGPRNERFSNDRRAPRGQGNQGGAPQKDRRSGYAAPKIDLNQDFPALGS